MAIYTNGKYLKNQPAAVNPKRKPKKKKFKIRLSPLMKKVIAYALVAATLISVPMLVQHKHDKDKYEAEIEALGITDADVVVEYEVGETIVVTSGAWKDTVGMIKDVNAQKQSLTINVELFGRETPVELSFSEVKRM